MTVEEFEQDLKLAIEKYKDVVMPFIEEIPQIDGAHTDPQLVEQAVQTLCYYENWKQLKEE